MQYSTVVHADVKSYPQTWIVSAFYIDSENLPRTALRPQAPKISPPLLSCCFPSSLLVGTLTIRVDLLSCLLSLAARP